MFKRYSLTVLAVCVLAFSSACAKSPTLTAPGMIGASALRSNSVARSTSVTTTTASRNTGKTTVEVDNSRKQSSDYSNEEVSAEISRQGSMDQNDSWE